MRNPIDVDHLFSSGLSFERLIIYADNTFILEKSLRLMVSLLEVLRIKALFLNFDLTGWFKVFIGNKGGYGEWRFFISEAHFYGMRSKLKDHCLAPFILQFMNELAFGLEILDGVLHGNGFVF